MTSAEEWRAMIKRVKGQISDASDAQEEADEAPFRVLETGIPLGVLPSTPKRIWRNAGEAGFVMQGYESRVAFEAARYKTGDKKGEVKKGAFEQRNIFFGGYVPGSHLRFKAAWLGSKFSVHCWDPVGRYENDVRQTYWMEKSSRAFEKWIAEWGYLLVKQQMKEAV